mmetsp:Transcript_21912/g.50029  ORF Transcript_21912/g.50029 Transcript_21912/m.50029 type:complete len:251 (+) Transcript_21912:68-820(+)
MLTSCLLLIFSLAPIGCAVDSASAIASHVIATVPAGDIQRALSAFIDFSEKEHLGLHLGRQKGDLLTSAVSSALPTTGSATVLELGCHAGDGTLSVASALQDRPGSIIISAEANKKWLRAASQVLRHAGQDTGIEFYTVDLPSGSDAQVFDAFLDRITKDYGVHQLDAVVLDHDEALFLPHLKLILKKGLLRIGGVVYVDNVKRKAQHLKDYLSFVLLEPARGFNTELKEVTEPYSDAVAISTYISGTEL